MSVRYTALPSCSFVLIICLLSSGCLTEQIGDARYNNGNISVSVTNNGEPSSVYVQVTVYKIENFHQEKMTILQVPADLQQGKNEVIVPGTLPFGTYKLYVYILKDGGRGTAAIRDIVV
jgi:hypothetical protein